MANPRQDRSWTPIQRFPPILSSSLWTHRAPTRRLPSPMSRDTGRAATGRDGSFNSGKNYIVLPEEEVRGTGTGKNNLNEPADRRWSGPCQSSPFSVPLSTSPTHYRLRADGHSRAGLNLGL